MRLALAGVGAIALLAVAQPPAVAQSAGQAPATAVSKPSPDSASPGVTDAPAADGASDPATGDALPPLAFEGGRFTVTQPEQYGEKILSYDGKEIARDYFVMLDKVVEVSGKKVAIYDVGPGGNACGPAALLVWKPDAGGGIETVRIGEDCGAPPAAVSDYNIVFLPYVLPGATALVQTWSPETGLTTAGELSFSPEPGTGWKDLHPSKLQSMIDTLRNAAVYRASRKLLGKRMEEVVTGLSVSGAPETTKMGLIYGNGCTPHACGAADSFMAVDTRNKAVYFAHQGEKGIDAWPALKRWPAAIRGLMSAAIAPN
jgi:hypothetical protein